MFAGGVGTMALVSEEAGLYFIALYTRLLYYAGQKRKVLPSKMTFDKFLDTSYQRKADCRDAIYEPTPLLDDFLADNADALSSEEQDIVRAWKRYVRGTFVVLRHHKNYTIFLGTGEESRAYAVLGLTTDLAEMAPKPYLPVIVKTVLLPYEGVIVCDGLVVFHNVTIGPNMRR